MHVILRQTKLIKKIFLKTCERIRTNSIFVQLHCITSHISVGARLVEWNRIGYLYQGRWIHIDFFVLNHCLWWHRTLSLLDVTSFRCCAFCLKIIGSEVKQGDLVYHRHQNMWQSVCFNPIYMTSDWPIWKTAIVSWLLSSVPQQIVCTGCFGDLNGSLTLKRLDIVTSPVEPCCYQYKEKHSDIFQNSFSPVPGTCQRQRERDRERRGRLPKGSGAVSGFQ